MKHYHEIKVRGFHTDMFGHVNNARYLEFLEEARWEFLEDHLEYKKWQKLDRAFIVVNINISYRQPSVLSDLLEIESYVSKIGNKSGTIHQNIYKKDSRIKITDADITFVVINTKTNKSVQIEGDIKETFQNLLHT